MMHCVLLSVVLAAPPIEDASDHKAMEPVQGTWKVVSAEREGRQLTKEEIAAGSKALVTHAPPGPPPQESTLHWHLVSIKGDNVTIGDMDFAMIGRVVVTPGPKFGTVDLMMGGQKMYQGIYRLEKDALTVCFAESGKPRPTEFVTKPDSGLVLATLRR